MPDCYLCGSYIERGAGYRRPVQIESSVRVYFSRRGGGSYGARTSLRTLCKQCANMEDQVNEGAAWRFATYILGYAASAWFGWQLITSQSDNSKIAGLIFLLGIPVAIAAYVLETKRRHQIVRKIADKISDENSASRIHYYNPPDVKSDPQEDVKEKSLIDLEKFPEEFDEINSYRHDDNVFTWSDRIVEKFNGDENQKKILRIVLMTLARYTYPEVGENIRDFSRRAKLAIKDN